MKALLSNIFLVLFLWISGVTSSEAQGTRIDFSTIPRSGTILIYSHLDDDLIWMLPFWRISEKFIGGAMPATPTYRTIISQQQSFLNSNGYNIEYQSNWFTPWDDISDKEYSEYYWGANASYNYLLNDHLETRLFNNTTELSRYEINKIKAKLEQYFADPSMRRVITHNNWGEYGHQHHKALNKAVRELAVKYRRDVWMLGCDNGGFVDVNVPNGITYAYGSFNTPSLYTGIRTIYSNNGRWTWYTDRVPSGDHKFIRIVEAGSDKSYILKGDPITHPGPSQQESGAFIFDGDDDFMTLKGNNNSSFTIGMKVMPDQIREMDISAMSEYPTSGKNDRNLYLNSDGSITARIYDGSSKVVTSSARISANTWTHIAISGNGSNLKLYINGTLDKTITAGTAITNYATPELILGAATRTGTYFKGQINDVKLFNRVLSDEEISNLSGNINRYSVYTSSGTDGTINPSGTQKVSSGTNITFNIVPASGYMISEVKVDNKSIGVVSSYTFRNITSDHSISATFVRLTSSITADAGTGGEINPMGSIIVNYGSSRSFSVTPAKGYRIADLIVDNSSVGAVDSYSFYNVTANHTISAFFTPLTYSINCSAGRNGHINPSGTIVTAYGTGQTFTIEADRGYQIESILVDGNPVGTVSQYTFNDITSDHTISAIFKRLMFSIMESVGPGGSINPSGQSTVFYGDDLNYSITPAKGYQIEEVIVDNVSVGAVTNYSFSDVTSDHSISVRFRPTTFTVTATSGAGGSISPEGDSKVGYGHDQSYSILPEYGYKINNLIVDYHPVNIASNEFSFRNITENHTISVNFSKLMNYSINIGYLKNGSISPSGDTSVFEGSDQTYIIKPAPGYRVSMVFIDTIPIGPVNEYIFSNISADHSISATFSSSVKPELYPNPFRQGFSLNIRSPYDNQYEISIITLGYRVVYHNSEIPANTTVTLAPKILPGFYVLNIYYKGRKVAFARIVKN